MKKQKLLYIFLFLLLISNILLILINLKIKEKYEAKLTAKAEKEVFNQFNDYLFWPFVFPENYNVKIGEKYIAHVHLLCLNEEELPVVLINDSVGKNEWKFKKATDTLKYDDYYNSFVFENASLQKGMHYWNGVIIHNYRNKPDSLFIQGEYYVE